MRTLARGWGKWATWLALLAMCAALIFLTDRLRSSQAETETLRETLQDSQALAIRNRETLRELCRTNGIVAAILTEERDLRRELLSAGAVPKTLRDRWLLNQVIYDGFLAQLSEQTACAEVIRP